ARQRVPVVAGGNRDGVDRGVLDDPAQVLHVSRAVLAALLHDLHRRRDHVGINVADRRDGHVVHRCVAADVILPAAVDADDGDAYDVVGADLAAARLLLGGGRPGGQVRRGKRGGGGE